MPLNGRPSILVAQLGARRHYAVPRALNRLGLLEHFVTDACADLPPWCWLDTMLPQSERGSGLRRLLGRSVPEVPRDRISGFPLFALSARWDHRKDELQTDRWARRNAAFGKRVTRLGFGEADTVYAFNGAALEIFQAARQQSLRTVLDQTAAPWRWNARLLREERERWPGWEDQPAEIDESGHLSEREEAEWELADRIICGSEFAASALAEQGGPKERCRIVPYAGHILALMNTTTHRSNERPAGPLRVLFVGTLQLRKGVQYLWQAKHLLGNTVTIRLVGPSQLSELAMRELRQSMEVVGAVPRHEVSKHYAWADVFVLPTLSEGSANVCYEAMAAGLPVITTASAGSIIPDGCSGLIMPIRDAEALVQAITKLAGDTKLRTCMGQVARSHLAWLDFNHYATELSLVLGVA